MSMAGRRRREGHPWVDLMLGKVEATATSDTRATVALGLAGASSGSCLGIEDRAGRRMALLRKPSSARISSNLVRAAAAAAGAQARACAVGSGTRPLRSPAPCWPGGVPGEALEAAGSERSGGRQGRPAGARPSRLRIMSRAEAAEVAVAGQVPWRRGS